MRSVPPRAGDFKPSLPIYHDKPYNTNDQDGEYGSGDEWSTLSHSKSKSQYSRHADNLASNRNQGHGKHHLMVPSTPSHKVPLFRQKQGNIASTSGSRMMFRPTPRNDTKPQFGNNKHEAEYKINSVPNGYGKSYAVEEMAWTGAQQKMVSARENQKRQDSWARQTQREIESRGVKEEAGDWTDEWKRQNKRRVEENPHKQYAYDAKRPRGSGSILPGRAFGL